MISLEQLSQVNFQISKYSLICITIEEIERYVLILWMVETHFMSHHSAVFCVGMKCGLFGTSDTY